MPRRWNMRWMLALVAAVVVTVGGCSDSSHQGMRSQAGAKYKCSMDGGERETPGPCPKCGMALPEKK